MKDGICEPNPKVAVSCRPPSSLWRHCSTEKFQSRPKMASTTSQRETSRRLYVIYFFILHRWAKLAEHCAMEPDYFGSFKQSRWLSIFVVHEIQLRPRCIMESVDGWVVNARGHSYSLGQLMFDKCGGNIDRHNCCRSAVTLIANARISISVFLFRTIFLVFLS